MPFQSRTNFTIQAPETAAFRNPDIVALTDAKFAIAWEDRSTVKGEIFNPSGDQIDEFTLPTTSIPILSKHQDDSFVVVGRGNASNNNRDQIRADILDSDGSIQNTFFTEEVEGVEQADPDVTSFEDGTLGIVWETRFANPSVQGGLFAADGTKLSSLSFPGELQDAQHRPVIASIGDEKTAVAWQEPTNGVADQIRGAIFDSTGEQTNTFKGPVPEALGPNAAEITNLQDNGFALTWSSGRTISVGIFDETGTRKSVFTIRNNGDDLLQDPRISSIGDGKVAVAWQNNESPESVEGSVLTLNGRPTSSFSVKATPRFDQHEPSITQLSEDSFGVAWERDSEPSRVQVEIFEKANDTVDLATEDSGTTEKGEQTTIDLLANDGADTADGLRLLSVVTSENGQVRFRDEGKITYDPNDSFVGTDTIFYTVADASGRTDEAAVSITVGGDNRPPQASSDEVTTGVGETVSVDVRSNDSDPDGDTLSIQDPGDPANGEVAVTDNGEIEFTPDSGFTGQDSFTYTVADGNRGTDTAQVSIEVEETADAGGNPPRGETPNIVVLSGESQTIPISFAADVRGTAAAETVQVTPGANVQFGGNTGDEVEFTKPLAEHTFTQSGNVLTVEGPSGERAEISLNADVEVEFADGAATASLVMDDGISMEVGDEPLGDLFDPADVNLDGEDVSALAVSPDTSDGLAG